MTVARKGRGLWPVAVAILLAGGPAAAAEPVPAGAEIPAAMRACAGCHRSIVAAYLEHGMARSVGPVGTPAAGSVTNPRSGTRYRISADGQLSAEYPDGGRRVQRLVGRIGAGIFDTSWVGAEVDVLTGQDTGRLFFAPLETIRGHGLELSPFELADPSPGLDLALTEGCLTCHTATPLESLSGAATAAGSTAPGEAGSRHVFPPNALGAAAFDELEPFGCDTCHGDPGEHLQRMSGPDDGTGSGLLRLGDLAPGVQRDVCARCHLQGDARLDLTAGASSGPLAGRIPVLVPARPGAARALDDFRFVGQLERLALSPCFRGSPAMTCTTCHRPHQGVAAQGVASFDAACDRCHQESCSRPPELAVEEVTGQRARSRDGCVDCHLRRSQPFDLPHVRSADHHIRRRIPRPRADVPHRQFADREGELRIYDDGRLRQALATPAGRRWRSGVVAMGLLTLGRFEEAAERFSAFPPPGSPAARRPSAPAGLLALESRSSFHESRALALLSTGQAEGALAAFGDALALDPLAAGPRMGRARLRFDAGDLRGALADTQAVIDAYPRAEQPWQLRARMGERLGRFDLAASAFDAATRLWPSDPVAWFKLGLLLRQRGEEERARQAIARARAIRPSLTLPGAGSVAEH